MEGQRAVRQGLGRPDAVAVPRASRYSAYRSTRLRCSRPRSVDTPCPDRRLCAPPSLAGRDTAGRRLRYGIWLTGGSPGGSPAWERLDTREGSAPDGCSCSPVGADRSARPGAPSHRAVRLDGCPLRGLRRRNEHGHTCLPIYRIPTALSHHRAQGTATSGCRATHRSFAALGDEQEDGSQELAGSVG